MLAKAAVVSLFILLVWGNMVSGLQAGLACPDWPLCHGRVLPPYRWDIYMEFMHRVIGAIASVLIIILCYKRFRDYSGGYRSLPVLTVLLLVLQIFLGGIVVLLELPVNITTLHFGNAMLIFALVLFQAYYDGVDYRPAISLRGINGLLLPMAVIIFIQTVLGAFVRHSDAGLACPDFPRCLGYWLPPTLTGTILTHYSHRLLAYFIVIVFFAIFIYSRFNSTLNHIKYNINLILLFLILQIIVGAFVVLTGLRFYLTAIHLSFAIIIFSITLVALFKTSGNEKYTG